MDGNGSVLTSGDDFALVQATDGSVMTYIGIMILAFKLLD